jgi:cyclopropane-fatty-acyl-phospholipid synthase
MATATVPATDPAVKQSINVLAALTEGYGGNFAVRFWDGQTWEPKSGARPFTLLFKHPGAVRAMFWPFDRVGLGEAYIFDDFDIDGDIFAFTEWLRHIVKLAEGRSLWAKLRLVRALWKLPNQKNERDRSKAGRPTEGDHSRAKDREAISYAYNLSNEFYNLFLDPTMLYSCAYFGSPDDTIENAQQRKLHYICRKLALKPGEKLLDFGCGWGALVIHAAKHYGVHATGVTLAGEQAKWCERAIDQAGVRDRVKVIYSDYRDFQAPDQFDKVSSVGMSEHIGVKQLPVLFGKVFECLRPGGRYLHHCITLRPYTPYPRWTAFARKYCFPNGELQTILQIQDAAAGAGFEIRDVENLREHYVHTLESWVRRLEAKREEAVKLVGEVFYRVFRIYMAGATLGFKYGTYGLNQVLVSKPHNGSAQMPLTRAEWYA